MNVQGAGAAPASAGLVAPGVAPRGSETSGGGFQGVFDRLLRAAAAPQQQADAALRQMATGESDNMHQVMLAVANADLVFRLALEVRNRLTEALQEIQRMQV
jgi:flagellar hook-basal body complex protein FliE